MRDILTHIMEADIFKPASQRELNKRRAEAESRAKAARKAHEEKLGRKLDTCPNCGVDLRNDDAGVYATETIYGTASLFYSNRNDSWEYGTQIHMTARLPDIIVISVMQSYGAVETSTFKQKNNTRDLTYERTNSAHTRR